MLYYILCKTFFAQYINNNNWVIIPVTINTVRT